MTSEEHMTMGWNADSWIPRAVKHLVIGDPVLDDFSLERLGVLGEAENLPVSHGVLHAFTCTAHLLHEERLRYSFLRMLTVWYYGMDIKKSGPYTVVWEDRLPDERQQKGYDELCKRLVDLYEEDFPAMTLSSGQSSFKWMGHYEKHPKLLTFMRESETGESLIFLINTGNEQVRDLDFGVPEAGDYEILLDTTQLQFIGGKAEDTPPFSSRSLPTKGYEHCLFIDMQPASAFILRRKEQSRDQEIEAVLKKLDAGGFSPPPAKTPKEKSAEKPPLQESPKEEKDTDTPAEEEWMDV